MKKRRYTPQQKREALLAIEQHGDISYVGNLLNIPPRTLYDWHKKQENRDLQENFVPPPPQFLQNPQNVPPLEQSAFGMTREELARALEVEYIPSPYNDLRQALMKHINTLQVNIPDDPDLAHIRALAVSRMLDDVLRLEPLCRLEKPPINIIKYEYPDGTYHDTPEWTNVIYQRAQQAYDAVMRQARREYYALKGEDYEESAAYIDQPSLEELAQMHFTAEDFIPQHTGIIARFEDLKKQQTNYLDPANHDFFNED